MQPGVVGHDEGRVDWAPIGSSLKVPMVRKGCRRFVTWRLMTGKETAEVTGAGGGTKGNPILNCELQERTRTSYLLRKAEC